MTKNKKLLMFAGLVALLHHFVGHYFIQKYLINTLGWGTEFFNGLPALFLGSTFAVTLYIFFIVWFLGSKFKSTTKFLKVFGVEL